MLMSVPSGEVAACCGSVPPRGNYTTRATGGLCLGGARVLHTCVPPAAHAANWSLHKPLTAASMKNYRVIGGYT